MHRHPSVTPRNATAGIVGASVLLASMLVLTPIPTQAVIEGVGVLTVITGLILLLAITFAPRRLLDLIE